MRHTHIELDPVRDEKMWKAIRHQLAKLRRADGNRRTPWAQLEVEAVVTAASAGDGERIPEILLLVDDATLRDGLHPLSVCETENGIPVPVSTVRRLCCEAEIVPIIIGDDRQALAVGRSVRTATRAQRRALAAMYRTCANPDCTAPFDQCRIHHVNIFWHHHGPTDLDNLTSSRYDLAVDELRPDRAARPPSEQPCRTGRRVQGGAAVAQRCERSEHP